MGKKKNKRIFRMIIIVAIFGILYFLFLNGNYSLSNLFNYKDELQNRKMEVKLLKENIKKQKDINTKLKNKDSFEMEKKARESGMIKPGEKIYKYNIKPKEN